MQLGPDAAWPRVELASKPTPIELAIAVPNAVAPGSGEGPCDVAPTALALVALGLGDLDDAFRWLERAVEVRDPHVVPLRCYPPFQALRADSRYGSLLERLRLSPSNATG